VTDDRSANQERGSQVMAKSNGFDIDFETDRLAGHMRLPEVLSLRAQWDRLTRVHRRTG
jgi:hypothetical protein